MGKPGEPWKSAKREREREGGEKGRTKYEHEELAHQSIFTTFFVQQSNLVTLIQMGLSPFPVGARSLKIGAFVHLHLRFWSHGLKKLYERVLSFNHGFIFFLGISVLGNLNLMEWDVLILQLVSNNTWA